MTVRGTAVAVLLLIAAATAGADSIPHPELDGLEQAVAEQVRGLRDAIERTPRDEHPATAVRYAELGALYHSLEFLDAALACYRKAAALAPDDGRWPYLQGILHTENGDVEAARSALERAIALQPDLKTAWARLGRLALDEGNAELALEHFERAIAELPDSGAALAGAGQALLELGRAREAVEKLEQALRVEPRANRLHYPLAMAYRALGDQASMRAHLDKVGPIGVSIDDPIADYANHRAAGARVHIRQGNKAYRAGDYASAAEFFTQATEAAPDLVPAWTNLGVSQAALGRHDEAKRSLRRALGIEPGNKAALGNLLRLLLDDGENEAALSLLDEHLAPGSDNRELLSTRAALRSAHGSPSAAAEDYRRLTSLEPTDSLAWKRLVVARIQAGQYDRVEDLVREAESALGNLPAFKLDLVEALLGIHGNDPDAAEVARNLARGLYDDRPSAAHALRVVRTLLLGRADCTAASQWLESRIADADTADALQSELLEMREKLRGVEQCRAAGPAGEDG